MPRPTGQDFPVVENSLSPAISAQKFRLPHHFPPLFYPARHFVDTFSKRVSRFITMPSPRLRLFGLLLSLVGSVHSQAQVSITASGTYTQDFDTLITTASATWTDNSTLTNWSAQRTGTGNTIAAGTGSSITGALYSFGTGTASDRALGTLGSATPGGFAYGVIFQNNSGATVTLGTLSYMGEQWRNSAAAAQDVTVWYKIGSSPITNFSAGSDVGWNQLAALTFTSPITGGTAGALDGNASANRASLSASRAVSPLPAANIWPSALATSITRGVIMVWPLIILPCPTPPPPSPSLPLAPRFLAGWRWPARSFTGVANSNAPPEPPTSLRFQSARPGGLFFPKKKRPRTTS